MQRPLNVLVVDDDPIQSLCSSAFLTSESIWVTTAISAKQGLVKLDEGDFDMILLDYEMPGMNGVEFLHAARAAKPGFKTPVMLVTQHRDPAIANAAYEAGVCDVFIKPVDWRLLAQMVKYYISQPGTRRTG